MTALVTGASSGIGLAIAEVLAAHGHDLVLVARREDRLRALQARIESLHPVTVTVLMADLSEPDSAEKIYATTENAGLHIDLLINNAGYAVSGRFGDIAWQTQAALMQVLAGSPARLIHLYLPGMLKAGYGRVMNVASVGAFMPGMPGMTLYAGLKQFVLATSYSLSEEYRGTGITFTALCPGATETEWAEKSGAKASYAKVPKRLILSPQACAIRACDAMFSGKALVVTGLSTRLTAALSPFLPRQLALRFWRKTLLGP